MDSSEIIEAAEWLHRAPSGSSEGHVFRLADGRLSIVKFPENQQGEMVLANEFLSCRLAEELHLPINRSVIVAVDERLIKTPRANGGMNANFSAGLRCGMIYFEQALGADEQAISNQCQNASELHHVAAFEQFVGRGDGRQLLTYMPPDSSSRLFAAYDYGFAFGGQPSWTIDSLNGIPAPALPAHSPFGGAAYTDGAMLQPMIDRLKALTEDAIRRRLAEIRPPRWGVTQAHLDALAEVLKVRGASLVAQFEARFSPQIGML